MGSCCPDIWELLGDRNFGLHPFLGHQACGTLIYMQVNHSYTYTHTYNKTQHTFLNVKNNIIVSNVFFWQMLSTGINKYLKPFKGVLYVAKCVYILQILSHVHMIFLIFYAIVFKKKYEMWIFNSVWKCEIWTHIFLWDFLSKIIEHNNF